MEFLEAVHSSPNFFWDQRKACSSVLVEHEPFEDMNFLLQNTGTIRFNLQKQFQHWFGLKNFQLRFDPCKRWVVQTRFDVDFHILKVFLRTFVTLYEGHDQQACLDGLMD